ncbi:modulator of macroautophagy TMEM150B-A isoform X1 [Xenopus laevis]|uniref:Modulator of macroautophagy TMEM150B-A isoform X1 n=1 Tax=Xenopus laevis TaxID=8355 RepID=A0A8J1LAI1_XENLA|nr:modulator of macroautophagy TMEM150B-A isoform X1 [Xenopus laevis]
MCLGHIHSREFPANRNGRNPPITDVYLYGAYLTTRTGANHGARWNNAEPVQFSPHRSTGPGCQQSNQLETHLAGAFLAFVIGNIYFWMQTALTYMVKPTHGGCYIGPIRFCLSVACTALIVLMAVFLKMNMKSISAICEWIVAMILFLLYGLFAVDFWHLDGHYFHVKKRTVIPNEMQVSTVTLSI